MKPKFLVVLFLICGAGFLSVVSGQDTKSLLTGKLTSFQGEAVVGGVVSVEGSIRFTSSDLEGRFEIRDMKPGVYMLECTSLGFKSKLVQVEIFEEQTTEIHVVFEEDQVLCPEVMIVGTSHKLFHKIPGSVHFINQSQLKMVLPLSGNEIFRKVPGLHIVEEEGLGLRINLGIRGLDPDRSRSLLILEDGIPVALAPYGEPEMYFTPAIERMTGIEVLKGSGQILFGPQTIGGVINYITARPPLEKTFTTRLTAGPGGYLQGLLQFGNTVGNTGYQITGLKKRADKLGTVGFDITDIQAKMVISFPSNSSFSLKTGYYMESSNSTYIGLTQPMFDQRNLDYAILVPDDKLIINRINVSATYDHVINHRSSFKTTAFAYTTTRNWRRQDFSYNGTENKKPNLFTGIIWGDESFENGAIYLRSSTANRNRRFEVAGLESRYSLLYKTGNIQHAVKVGARYLQEIAFEQRINGSKPDAGSGELVEDEVRPGKAISLYLNQQSTLFEGFDVHYGVRQELFNQSREIFRRRYSVGIRDTLIENHNIVSQWIPGGGFTTKLGENNLLFGGVHVGFAPPRTKDAISNEGEVYELEAEKSINTELGLRLRPARGFFMEVTGFFMHFRNQIIPVSESSGGTGFGLVNGGKTVHQGVEYSMECNFSELLGLHKNKWLLDFSATFSDARFSGDRFIDGKNISGNITPYAPRLTMNSSLEYATQFGLMAWIGGQYTGKQFTDQENTTNASNDGRSGMLPGFFTLNGSLKYHLKKWKTDLFISGKNLTNERFITSRRPQGIRVGLPLLIMAGFEWRL